MALTAASTEDAAYFFSDIKKVSEGDIAPPKETIRAVRASSSKRD